MASGGAVTYSELLDMPILEVILIADAITKVIEKRNV